MTARWGAARGLLALLAVGACVGQPRHGLGEGIEAEAIDWSADPCQDLYRYACGNWEHWHDFYPDTSGRSRTIDRQDETEAMYQLVSGAGESSETPVSPDQQTVRRYYRSCQSSTIDDNREAVAAELEAIANITTAADLARVLARLHADGISALFWLGAGADPGSADLNVLHLQLDGWSLPDRTQYGPDDRFATVRQQYREHVAGLTDKFSRVVPLAIAPAAVLKIEGALALGSPSKAEQALPESGHHLVDRGELALAATGFAWDDYLTAAGVGPFTTFNLDHAAGLRTLATVFAAGFDELKAYLAWRVLEAHGWAADLFTAGEEFDFHRKKLAGVDVELPRYWECFLDATGWMEPLLAPLYVQRRFSAQARAEATRLIEGIRTAMAARISSRPWLDEATRQEALAKLAAVEARVGFPDTWPATGDYTFDEADGFIANRISLRRKLRARNLALAGTPVDRTRFAMSPLAINAAYIPELNQIVFPAAILQPPFFAPGRATAVNLGAIGTVMGHEMTHGFDDWGRHFDGHGGLRDWWTPAVSAEFTRRAQCLVDEYSAFQLPSGQHVDGAFTLGENIADVGGLQLAHDAWLGTGQAEDNDTWLTRSQQFFVAFAQNWCGRNRPQAAEVGLLADPHSPARFRVNGAVANVPAFRTAFSCRTGAALAPATGCELW
jgi:putative endopeptidase